MRIPTETEFWSETKYAIRAISQDAPAGHLIEKGPSWLYISGQEDPWLNLGYAYNRLDLAVLSRELNKQDLPGIIYGHHELPHQNVAEGRFLRCSTLMFQSFDGESANKWNFRRIGAKIEQVSDPQNLDHSNMIQSRVFGMSFDVLSQVVGDKVLNDPQVDVYNLLERHQPVSTVTVYKGGMAGSPVVEIWSMATLPMHQRQGFGEHLLAEILTDSQKKGFHGAGLMASEEGKGLYQKLGFTSVLENPLYEISQR